MEHFVSVGIVGYGAYIPRLRLSRKAVVEGQRLVCAAALARQGHTLDDQLG